MIPTPIADAYVPSDAVPSDQARYPLDLYLCKSCGHVQLLDVVDPDLLFRSYIYFTANSLGLQEHFTKYAEVVSGRVGLAPGSLVVDIGSNDGTLLRFFKDRGMRVLGVDPATEIACRAAAVGIDTIPEFYTSELARRIRGEHGTAAVITANNVFAHADDLASMAVGIRELLAPDGMFIFEVSYLVDIVQSRLFDTIYHEHVSYHSVGPLEQFFRRHELELFDAERIPLKGGSLRGFVQRAGGPWPATSAGPELLTLEARLGVTEPHLFRRFAADLQATKADLQRVLREVKAQGRSIAGFGASATVTTLIYQFELGEFLSFIVDDNPRRHGLFSPGHHIPVVSPQMLYERRPDYVVILAWVYAEPIMQRHRAYQDRGGRFVLPMPKVQVM
jgi:SAM-dependent methyltransferase